MLQKQPLDAKLYISFAKEMFKSLGSNEEDVTPELVYTIFSGDKTASTFVGYVLGKGYTIQQMIEAEQSFVEDTLQFVKDNW